MKRLHSALIVLILTIATSLIATATPPSRKVTTTRRTTKASSVIKPSVQQAATPSDTLAISNDSIAVSGYDKPLRSNRESAFFTNKTYRQIDGIIMQITYLDAFGRTLHQRKLRLATDLPPYATRQFYWPSWDRQQSFYYRLSQRPRRADATPYDVKCHVDSIVSKKM